MAVYTIVSEDEIKELLQAYDIGQLEGYQPIEKGIENSNYLLKVGGQKYIFTIFENRVENADLPFFIRLTSHLRSKGINCPVNLTTKTGEQLVNVKGKKAAIISFLEGAEVEKIEKQHIAQLGATLAKMHMAVADFKEVRKNSFALSKWVELLGKIGERANELKAGLAEYIAKEIEFLAANWPFNLPSGVIHADLFPDNVFFKDNKISGVIDFYFSSSDYFAYDAAICINAWGIESSPQLQQVFWDAYQAIRPLTPDEQKAMPVLLRGAAMRFLITRLYDWFNTPQGALVKKKDPMEYLQKLEALAST